MDSFFGHRQIPSKQLLALVLSQGWAVLIHPLSIETSKAAIAGRPISGRAYIRLSALRPPLAAFYYGHAAVVRPPVPRMFVYQDAV